MSPSNHAVSRVIPIEQREDLQSAGGVPPIAHELAHDSEVREDLHARVAHAVVGLVADLGCRRAGGFLVREYAIPGFAEGEG